MQRRFTHSASMIWRSLTIVLLCVYLLFSVGIIKATHFCMGREASVQFFTSEAKKCPCAKYVTEKESCCDDQHELLKVDDDHKSISKVSASDPVWKVERIFTERLLAEVLGTDDIADVKRLTKAPPKIPLWKAHRSYVFYDGESNNSIVA